jgi:L-alanine-DL-glutamate epimerase-like enolase superfamily enzyme
MQIIDITMMPPLYVYFSSQGDARETTEGYTTVLGTFIQITTDEGITGLSPASSTPTIKSFIFDTFKPLLIGEDPFEVEKIWDKLYWTTFPNSRRGAGIRALSFIDIALWDIIAKTCKQPIDRLLGGHRKKVAAYGSGVNLSLSIDELVKQNQRFVDMGFKMVKMKIGQKDMREDIRRVKAVRDAIGYDIDIAVDANNMYGVTTAINMANKLEKYEIYWFEEPILLDNIEGIIKLAKSTSIPIAGYELENTKYGFKELIARGAIGICQADAAICGGITEWRKIAALAECYGMPMAPHGRDQLHVPLTAAIPNGLIVEWMEGFGAKSAEFVKNPIIPDKGEMKCKTIPGLGIEIDNEAIKKYSAKPSKMGTHTMNPRHQWPPYV